MNKSKLMVALGVTLVSVSTFAAMPTGYNSTYEISGKAGGEMNKQLGCSGGSCMVNSTLKVKKGFIRKTINRSATLTVAGDKVVETDVMVGNGDDAKPVSLATGQYDSLGVVFVLRNMLINGQALGSLDVVGKDNVVNKINFAISKEEVSLTTPAGTFNTVEVTGTDADGNGFVYNFDPSNNYMMVQAITMEDGDAVLTASLKS